MVMVLFSCGEFFIPKKKDEWNQILLLLHVFFSLLPNRKNQCNLEESHGINGGRKKGPLNFLNISTTCNNTNYRIDRSSCDLWGTIYLRQVLSRELTSQLRATGLIRLGWVSPGLHRKG